MGMRHHHDLHDGLHGFTGADKIALSLSLSASYMLITHPMLTNKSPYES